ncbi:HD-GYP domain-containing protein [Pseudorhodoferax sp. Leaf274]|uniref:HD-GYP domain-containing protein n=1 Tax=Pseudorhodoferax sp. Leaf274 TaxID=1736318 RepID=UPI000702C8B7|nr:HD-GYP domain-containing protein [Pseudorhodoferax sp. Leaf274]KQP44580.1 phosphohydrolase [Pseudorhodoferax sp. Leaf274]
MDDKTSQLIDVGQLRRGLFIQLDLGWMDHPFPRGSFKITSSDQIRTIRALGLRQVRYFPDRSDPEEPHSDFGGESGFGAARSEQDVQDRLQAEARALQAQRRQQLAAQQASLRHCEQRFGEVVQLYRRVVDEAPVRPVAMREQCEALVAGCVAEILVDGEATIRLLSEGAGEGQAAHPANTMVLALLLGRALGLPVHGLADLGMAALLHDLGKQQLPTHLRMRDERHSAQEMALYQSHVHESVKAGRRMGLSAWALQSIAQHHEMADGSGFPAGLQGPDMGTGGKVLALVNRYDRLCNPPLGTQALTPHEALALMFARHKACFDGEVLGAFIRMMGVYPPGSVVQLSNERFALVVSVNSTRPLKPRVLVHDPAVPPEQALILDLESAPEQGIRRSLKPAQLPAAARAYLAPVARVRCFYEHQPPTPAPVAA